MKKILSQQPIAVLFEKTTSIIFGVMILFLTIGLTIGAIKLFMELKGLWLSGDATSQYVKIVSEVLTLFVLIELSRSLVDYFNMHRLRLTFIVDAAIVFMLREVMIGMFEHKVGAMEVLSYSALLLVLGALRIGSILMFQREIEIQAHIPDNAATTERGTQLKSRS
jgi:uncharacterized membrane protein (DUF373 family)